VIGGSRLATKHDKITQTRNGRQTVNTNYVGGSRLSTSQRYRQHIAETATKWLDGTIRLHSASGPDRRRTGWQEDSVAAVTTRIRF
jgi:hypothetical protein